MSGWIKVHRGINNHWVWDNPEYLKWWMDILLEANYLPSKVVIKGTIYECKRGEKLYSLDTWAKRWNTNKSKVRRFLNLLQNDSMIELKSETQTTRITICNYDDYQDGENESETQMKRKRNANETHLTPIKERKKEKKENLLSETDVNDLDETTKMYFDIAVGFQKLFISNKKSLGIDNFDDQENATFKSYVEPIRLAFERDKRTRDDFAKIFLLLRTNDFWIKNIMSTSKLRDKMERLLIEASDVKKKPTTLPSDWFSRELTKEQIELLTDKQKKAWEHNKSVIAIEGGYLKPIIK